MILDYLLNITFMANLKGITIYVGRLYLKIKLFCTSFFDIWPIFFSPTGHNHCFICSMSLYYTKESPDTVFISTTFLQFCYFVVVVVNWMLMYYERKVSLIFTLEERDSFTVTFFFTFLFTPWYSIFGMFSVFGWIHPQICIKKYTSGWLQVIQTFY